MPRKPRGQTVIDRIMALPEEKRAGALAAYQEHQYFKQNEWKHIALIRDTPHKLLKVGVDGEWVT